MAKVLNYYDPAKPGSFTGPDKLTRSLEGVTKKEVTSWLSEQDPFTLHRQARRKFPRNKVVVGGIDDQWDGDTADMSDFHKDNDGYKYVLFLIDVFSRYLWTFPLKTKTAKEMTEAFEKVLTSGRKPRKLRTDKGTEYVNKQLSTYLKSRGVKHFVTENEPKANYAERVIKTIKKRLFRYFSHKQTHRWIDVLKPLTDSYNATFHSSIKMPPNKVNKNNAAKLWLKLYGQPVPQKKGKFKFKVGDVVRASYLKHVFHREYDQKWTGELFTVTHRKLRVGLPVYRLKDWDEEPITGWFYQSELQKVKVDPKGAFKIEKILKTRMRKKKKEHLVRWLHWPPKYDSWVGNLESI